MDKTLNYSKRVKYRTFDKMQPPAGSIYNFNEYGMIIFGRFERLMFYDHDYQYNSCSRTAEVNMYIL